VKIAYFITRMIVGGAQETALVSVQGLSAMPDHVVSLVTGPETGTEGNLLRGVDGDFEVAYVPTMVRAISPLNDVRALQWTTRWFATERPDVVHTHSSKAGVIGRLAARRARVPHVVHTLHALVFHDGLSRPRNAAYRTIKRTMVPFTDHYVSVSDSIRERAIAAGIGRPDQHSTIRSGFATERFGASLVDAGEARARLGLPDDRVVVGMVARLFPLKGHAELLPAAARLARRNPDVLFVFVGGGPLEAELRRTVREQELERHVVFLGQVPPDEVPVALSAFDVLAHTSVHEGLARVLPQGVLSGLPVVSFDLDGAAEVVREGANGYLVPPRDTDALTVRLELLVRDPTLRERLGGVGADEIREEFSIAAMVRKLDALYRDLAS
jgi:glycosyltransferase involved in cell wall biosynthesis